MRDLLGRKSKLVFWGTGQLGQRFYQVYCVEKNLVPKPIFWCDNAKNKQGRLLENIEIISPEDLKNLINENYHQSTQKKECEEIQVVITATGVGLLQIICQLEQMSLNVRIFSAVQLQARYYFEKNAKEIDEILSMMADEKSRCGYRTMIHNMMQGKVVDFSLYEPNQYIDNDVISHIDDNEVIVDAGVCDGEEIDKALALNNKILIHAFEPDCKSMTILQHKYKDDLRVNLHEYALWNEKTTLRFFYNIGMSSSSGFSAGGDSIESSVKTTTLDMEIKDKIGLIKMDIEGAEYQALMGAEETIRKYKPKLAICVYHRIEDYVKIPLLIKQLNPAYKLYFRQHSIVNLESVIYAI